MRSWGSSVRRVTKLQAGRLGFDSREGWGRDLSSSPPRPDRLGGLPSLLPNGYPVPSQGVKRPGVKLNILLQLVPRLRMRGAVCPLPVRLHGVVLS
jgi:hypothetical protein